MHFKSLHFHSFQEAPLLEGEATKFHFLPRCFDVLTLRKPSQIQSFV